VINEIALKLRIMCSSLSRWMQTRRLPPAW